MTRQLSYLVAPSSTPIPPQAESVGYATKTFDSTTLSNSVGGVYGGANFYGLKGNHAAQNADGSFTVNNMQQTLICTARLDPTSPGQFTGIAFGNGAYFECIAAWDPKDGKAGQAWPGIWWNDAETMAYNRVWEGNVWPGLTAEVSAGDPDIQLNFPTNDNYGPGNRIVFGGTLGDIEGIALGDTYHIVSVGPDSIRISDTKGGAAIVPTGSGTLTVLYGNWIEVDIEYDSGSVEKLGFTLINWNGYVGDGHKAHETWHPWPVITPPNSFANPNKFGMLWVPATDSAQGYVTFFFNDLPTYTARWNKYDPSLKPPPVLGSSAFSVIDTRHLIPILDTSAVYPMTVSSWKVWQRDVSGNIVNP